MRDGSLFVMLVIAGLLAGSAALKREGIDLRMALVSACEWVTGEEARY
ncbi:MAG: hypothetical protein RL071_2774 [Pseudomonadota bacterium]|jgi:hypothetical protein